MKLITKTMGGVGITCTLMGVYITSFDYIAGLVFMLYGVFLMVRFIEKREEEQQKMEVAKWVLAWFK